MDIKKYLTRLSKVRYMYILSWKPTSDLTINLNECDRVSSVSQSFNLVLNLAQYYIKDIKYIKTNNIKNKYIKLINVNSQSIISNQHVFSWNNLSLTGIKYIIQFIKFKTWNNQYW